MNSCMSRFVAVVALITAPITAIAAADLGRLPKMKSGLWVTTVTNEGMPPTTQSMCMDDATQQRLLTMGQGMMAGMCSKSDLRRDGAAFVFESECAMGPMKVKASGRTTFSGDTAYSSETTSVFDPPMMGKGTMRSTTSGRYSGPCPADMKPGDMKLPDGRVMNINNLQGLMKPPPR